MRIKKYDFDYGRRMLLQKAAVGASAGVLAPLWPLIGNTGDTSKAYPDELLSISMYTKGKIKPGDVVDANNVDVVKDLLDPIAYQQVKTMGRRINIVESTKDATKLFPAPYLAATLKNKGQAKLDANGNVVTQKGEPWIGGNPFPDFKDGIEATANLTMAWGRHDYSQYAVRDWDIAPDGTLAYTYDFVWAELNTTARSDGTVWGGKKDLLRYQSVWFTAPQDVAGTSFLNTWYYDQRKFPDLQGYLPAFKRVRQFPTNQRFEPLVPGVTIFLSDAWAAGDPMLTWGNYKIVGRKPMLGYVGGRNFNGGYNANYERKTHGGPKGQTFFETYAELVPETVIVEAEPTGYPRAPLSKKRTWIDVRNGMYVAYNTYDRRGEMWKSFEPAYAQYSNDKMTVKDASGHPSWSWTYVHSHDIQANRMSRFVQAKEVTGGYQSSYATNGVDVYNKYLTVQAIQRLGKALMRSVKPAVSLFAVAAITLGAYAPNVVASGSMQLTPVIMGTAHQALFSIAMDGNTGIAVGAGGQLMETADGGSTWKQSTANLGELSLLGVSVAPGHAVAVGQQGQVYVREGGKTWTKATSGTDNRLLSVAVNSKGLAVAVGAFGTALKSTDGGQNWEKIAPDWATIMPQGEEPHLYASHVDENGVITMAGEFGLILRSADGGATWKTLHKSDASVFAMQFRADGVGYAVGQAGSILRTKDSGATWTQLPTSTPAILLGVTSNSNGQVFVTGMHDMLVSTDDGASWSHASNPEITTAWYQGITSLDSKVLAVGHAGQVVNLKINP